jgi:predicted phage terminase large subunit-like protein
MASAAQKWAQLKAETAEVKLHPAQRSFLQSNSVFRAFVGGVGSGKSWAGSYDLIRRAKPGRLYAVVAPTYQMLSDATFRSFLQVAEQLGVVNRRDVKKSAPPAVKLRTGAEVLFRSADDPSRLYGPNLSGIWLDEASLMGQEAFTVGIGRLREGGEQGWLAATFTPKGKSHWTYQTFATSRPDTAIFYCRTKDNPFLPPQFADTVANQYTNRLALQELEGLFLDQEDGLFQRAWFRIVEAAPPGLSLLRAWDLAATPKDRKKAADPDYTCGVLMGKAPDGMCYVLDVKRLRGSPQQVEAAVKSVAELDTRRVHVWFEQEPGSSGKIAIDHFVRQVLPGYVVRGERSTGDKGTRAGPLAAAAERGLVKLVAGHWNKDLLDELEVFPFGAHDDQVDACSLAFNKLAQKQRFWIAHGGKITGEEPKQLQKPATYACMGRQEVIPADPEPKGIRIDTEAPGWQRHR